MDSLYDTIIIGGGPAGCAAAVYCARKEMKTLIIAESFGGQSIVSGMIENWIGEKSITGLDLAKKLEEHVRAYPQAVEVRLGERATLVTAIPPTNEHRFSDFEVKTQKGEVFKAKTVIVTTGARRRRLGVPGEDKFDGKGVAFCSTCDAPLFRDKKVVVVGSGNAGLESVHDLYPFASEVYILEREASLRGDPQTFDEIKTNPKLKGIIFNASVKEILGDNLVTGVRYLDETVNQEKTLEIQGVFIAIGSVPNSELVKGVVQVDSRGQIVIDAKHATTSQPGIFAAGDVTDDPYKQNNISVGDGVRAALASYAYLLNRSKVTPMAG